MTVHMIIFTFCFVVVDLVIGCLEVSSSKTTDETKSSSDN